MSNQDPQISEFGAIGSWMCIILAGVTAQDMAYYLACLVSVGALLINWDRYVASIKRQWRKLTRQDD